MNNYEEKEQSYEESMYYSLLSVEEYIKDDEEFMNAYETFMSFLVSRIKKG